MGGADARARPGVGAETDGAREDAQRVEARVQRAGQAHARDPRRGLHVYGPGDEAPPLAMRGEHELEVPGEALRAQARHEVGRDRAAHGLQAGLRVAQRQAEEQRGRELVEARERAPQRRPAQLRLGVVLAADGDVGVGRLEPGEQRRDVARRDLQVGVEEHDQRHARGGAARGERAPLAAVVLVHQHAHARVGGGDGARLRRRGVAAAVVDDDHLEGTAVVLEPRNEAAQVRRDVLGLVVGREQDGDARAHRRRVRPFGRRVGRRFGRRFGCLR